jgi:hypothetical protein
MHQYISGRRLATARIAQKHSAVEPTGQAEDIKGMSADGT